MFGDGSSSAGASVLDQFKKRIQSSLHPAQRANIARTAQHKHKPMDVYLSNDEYAIDPATVSMLGGGSNKHGANMLDAMIQRLRQHKSMNGHGLPPKAGHPEQYIGG